MAEFLSTVAAIAQFVDLACRSISLAKEVFQSADGLTKRGAELHAITNDFNKQCTTLRSDKAVVASDSLKTLLDSCENVAGTLSKELKRLQIDPDAATTWERLRSVWRTFRKKDVIAQLEQRLTDLRAQVCSNVIISLRDHQMSMMKMATSSDKYSRESTVQTRKTLEKIAQQVLNVTTNYSDQERAFNHLATELKTYVDQVWNRDRIEAILKSLHFDQIQERQSRVENAHKSTFEWIFDDNSPVNFGTWLREGHGTYWIEGKAGSGKSTLMKYLAHHPQTQKDLLVWAGPNELFIGSHFFWNAGTHLQKSYLGLQRTMLFQLLKKHPSLIPIACPDRFLKKSYDHLDSWTMEDITHSFQLILSSTTNSIRMCFFIDGLDEYDGIHTDLVKLLQEFAESDRVKLCVASRPWPEFREAYTSSQWTMCMHNYTRNDIYAFALDRLSESSHFARLRATSQTEADHLVNEISARSEGVFLWVYLVVRSLLRGLSNRDDLSVLYQRLLELPVELTAFFKHMFGAIDPVYMADAAELLMMMVASDDGPLPVFFFWASSVEKINGYRTSVTLVTGMSTATMLIPDEVDTVSIRDRREIIVDRYRDLVHAVDAQGTHPDIDIPDVCNIQIGFLHRTVVDFLRTSEMKALLVAQAAPGFDPTYGLLRGFAWGWILSRAPNLQSQVVEVSDQREQQRLSGYCLALVFRLAVQIHGRWEDLSAVAQSAVINMFFAEMEESRPQTHLSKSLALMDPDGPMSPAFCFCENTATQILMDLKSNSIPMILARMGLVKLLVRPSTWSPATPHLPFFGGFIDNTPGTGSKIKSALVDLARSRSNKEFVLPPVTLGDMLSAYGPTITVEDPDDKGSFTFHASVRCNVDVLGQFLKARGIDHVSREQFVDYLWRMHTVRLWRHGVPSPDSRSRDDYNHVVDQPAESDGTGHPRYDPFCDYDNALQTTILLIESGAKVFIFDNFGQSQRFGSAVEALGQIRRDDVLFEVVSMSAPSEYVYDSRELLRLVFGKDIGNELAKLFKTVQRKLGF